MQFQTKAIHAGDRAKPGEAVPITIPVTTAASFIYEEVETLDRVFGGEVEGPSYSRFGNPTCQALERLLATLESGDAAFTTSSGMGAMHLALQAALVDRPRSIVAANALFGATMKLLTSVLEPAGVDVSFADICDLEAVERTVATAKPAAIVFESVSNPVLRVGQMDRLAAIAAQAGAALVVDNTFATPLLLRPLEHGAHLVVHSLTKYLSGHGDVLGGAVICREPHRAALQSLSRTIGPNLGPFEAYLSMRGIKTFPLRMERQCQNAARVAAWLRRHPKIARVYYPDDPAHPDAAAIERLFPPGLRGAVVSIDLPDAGREEVFAFLNRLKLVVKATSLGDVHTMVTYPAISSHRELSPRQRQRLGIGDCLVRLSIGIEAVEDIVADLEQALG